MTMQHDSHPDDERLAAYAGGDRDALADPTLVAHLSACDRCGPMVDELSLMRSALAELPDLAPSRPLRLIPPVPAASAPRPTPLAWLRRLAGPAMAAGAGLVLIGAIGIGQSAVGDFFGKAGSGDYLQAAGPSQRESIASDSAHVPVPGSAVIPTATSGGTRGTADFGSSSEPPSMRLSPQASPVPTFEAAGGNDDLSTGTAPEQPWLTLLIAGVALFGTSAVLRFSISPRAG